MFMPAIRAIRVKLPLTLLVARVLADHEHRAAAADDLALLAHRLHRRSDLHAPRSTFVYVRTGAGPRSRRCARQPEKISSRDQAGCGAPALARAGLRASARRQGVGIGRPPPGTAAVAAQR